MDIKILREKLSKGNYVCFTTDLDWASECAIESELKAFMEANIKPTVFVTHRSNSVEKYRDYIDVGIHPNFIQPSSQGGNEDEIINYCMNIVPEAKSFRSHRWYGSNDIYSKLYKMGIKYESNLCTSLDVIEPFLHRSGMICFPCFLEDGAYIINNSKIDFKDVRCMFQLSGLKVVNIHPMHYALNTPYFSYTRKIKDNLTRQEWNEMTAERLRELEYGGNGIRNFIDEMIEYCSSYNSGVTIITLQQAYEMGNCNI